jgi:hypothetical protein
MGSQKFSDHFSYAFFTPVTLYSLYEVTAE